MSGKRVRKLCECGVEYSLSYNINHMIEIMNLSSAIPEVTPSQAEMQKLLKKIEETEPVSKTILCTGKGGVTCSTPNPSWPPLQKGQCVSEDYAEWIFKEMPKIISYIRTLEQEHRMMGEEFGALAEAMDSRKWGKLMAENARRILSLLTIK